ncbi:MAG: hypothetical protein NWS48_02460, partial [Akkermansiaceae bacterium]|jgi:hypothetical protein|nr:hypothetical protein [Akkermansiaceae bacterium]MDP4779306.1 hypothetical protein [Akkermansiaceae bacterium]
LAFSAKFFDFIGFADRKLFRCFARRETSLSLFQVWICIFCTKAQEEEAALFSVRKVMADDFFRLAEESRKRENVMKSSNCMEKIVL